jgi:hypothetical protein
MRITNDEEYFAILARIVKGAEYLENPLIKEDAKRKGMKLYDELCEVALQYRFKDSPLGRTLGKRV